MAAWIAIAPGALAQSDDVPQLTLKKALADIARAVAKTVKAENAKEIVVNPITDTGDLTHTAGVGLTDGLIAELKAEGIEPARKAEIKFEGSYAVGEAEEQAANAARRRLGFAVGAIKFVVKKRNGEILLNSEKDLDDQHQPRITDAADLQILAGGTGFQPPTAAANANNKTALDSIDNKPGLFEIQGARVRPKGAPYAIEMLVAAGAAGETPRGDAYRPRNVDVRDGAPFLKVQPGEAVAVRIINEANHDVASTVTIDGLSMFSLREDKNDKGEHVIVSAHEAGDILGWFLNNTTSRQFLVKDLPQDHPKAELLKNLASIGAITVTFAAAWEKDSQKPTDEPATRQATEIVPGAPIEAPYTVVKRHIGVFRASVTVRYDKK
jgi:hypothetical protein